MNGHIGHSTITAEKENIFMFAPNLIGYARIVLAVVSLWYMPLHPRYGCLPFLIRRCLAVLTRNQNLHRPIQRILPAGCS